MDSPKVYVVGYILLFLTTYWRLLFIPKALPLPPVISKYIFPDQTSLRISSLFTGVILISPRFTSLILTCLKSVFTWHLTRFFKNINSFGERGHLSHFPANLTGASLSWEVCQPHSTGSCHPHIPNS